MSSDETDVVLTLRERIAANPRPALIWVAGLALLILLELGRIVGWILAAGGAVRMVIGAIPSVPWWVADNVADGLSGVSGGLSQVGGAIGFSVTAALVLIAGAFLVKSLFVPFSVSKKIGLDARQIGPDALSEHLLERLVIAAGLGVGAALILVTPVGGAVDAAVASLTNALEWVANGWTLSDRELISNEGHRSPDGGWEGTFLGLSPAIAWSIRVIVIYAYAFAALVWLWKGYTTYREHYREADWTPRDDWINRFRTHYWGIFGLIVVFGFVVLALWAPALGAANAEANLYSPYQNEFEYLTDDGQVESVAHGTANIQSRSQGGDSTVGIMSYDEYDRWAPLGTNPDGKDLFTFLAFGARTSLMIGLIGIGIATSIALMMSLITSYYKGTIDIATIVVSDTIISVPVFLMVLLLSVVFQQGNHPLADIYSGGLLLALIFGALYWPGLWRAIRGPSLQVAEQEWVDAAKSYGQTPMITMRKHMAPYILSYILIYASLLLGGVIITTAALSFLGLGINPPTPEWGRMVSDGRSYVSTSSWHIATVPGILIVLVVTGFNALGDGIRDAMDPESESGDAGATAAATGGGG
ncbi:ABC transporter permease [Natrialbaceae archaeon A-chndr2]|uniref:ABC transporter permease n=1 Tax=Natronosalvus hydrolyticus TaxID=2979988 RepID=A0AAP2Z861_9EURY|nr:ABC transporter permease [Halobacteria archaeon AArc-curdl1]